MVDTAWRGNKLTFAFRQWNDAWLRRTSGTWVCI